MIPDVRNLKPGTLLKCNHLMRYFVYVHSGYRQEYIEIDQIVMFLDYKLKKSYDPLMINPGDIHNIKLKLLIDEGVHWIKVSSFLVNKLPEDLFDTNFACPYFDVVSSS
jgi:hypothetical protein